MYLDVSRCILMYLDVCERDTSRYKQDTFKIHHDTTGYVSDRKSPPPNDRKPPVTPFTRAVGAYTQRVHIYAPGCVYAGRCVYASGGCVYTQHRGCVYAPHRVYAEFCVYAPPTAYIRRNRRTVMDGSKSLADRHRVATLRDFPPRTGDSVIRK